MERGTDKESKMQSETNREIKYKKRQLVTEQGKDRQAEKKR